MACKADDSATKMEPSEYDSYLLNKQKYLLFSLVCSEMNLVNEQDNKEKLSINSATDRKKGR